MVTKKHNRQRPAKVAELLAAFQRAVIAREQMWDAERDIELLLGHDVDKLDSLIDIYAVAGAAGMGRDSVRSLREYAEENRADYKPTNYFSGKTGKVVKTL